MTTLNAILSSNETATATATELKSTVLNTLGESLGEWKAYDSQLPIADVKGTRIVKALYQVSQKTGKKKQENSYVRIPTVHLSEELISNRIAELTPFVLSWLQEQEDLILKAEHANGRLNVFTDGLSLDKVIEVLEANQTSGRLNKEMIESWFKEVIEEPLTLLFASKMGLDEASNEAELHKLELVLKAYKDKFASLASPKVFFKEEDCKSLIKVIESCEPLEEEGSKRSLIGSRFIVKLEGMSKKVDDVLLSL